MGPDYLLWVLPLAQAHPSVPHTLVKRSTKLLIAYIFAFISTCKSNQLINIVTLLFVWIQALHIEENFRIRADKRIACVWGEPFAHFLV